MKSKKDFTNCLVQYQGGGYSGCIWEWNYFLIDSQGKFHDIFSSGRNGISKEEQLVNFDFDDKDVYIYDLTDQKSIDEFVKESNEDNVVMVAKILQDFGYDLHGECDDCEQLFSLSEAEHSSYKGDGGIGVVYTGIVCPECYQLGTCEDCYEYFGQEEITYIESKEIACCEYCAEKYLTEYLPDSLINKVLFETNNFTFNDVEKELKGKIKKEVLDNLCSFEDLEKFAAENGVEFKPLDSNNQKFWGFFKPEYQLPDPNQLKLEL